MSALGVNSWSAPLNQNIFDFECFSSDHSIIPLQTTKKPLQLLRTNTLQSYHSECPTLNSPWGSQVLGTFRCCWTCELLMENMIISHLQPFALSEAPSLFFLHCDCSHRDFDCNGDFTLNYLHRLPITAVVISLNPDCIMTHICLKPFGDISWPLD